MKTLSLNPTANVLDNKAVSTQRFFSVMDGNKEVASVTLLTSAALEWNDDRGKRIVNQVAPDGKGGWTVIRQVTAEELLGALRS